MLLVFVYDMLTHAGRATAARSRPRGPASPVEHACAGRNTIRGLPDRDLRAQVTVRAFPDTLLLAQIAVRAFPDALLLARIAVRAFPDALLLARIAVRAFPDAPLLAQIAIRAFPDALLLAQIAIRHSQTSFLPAQAPTPGPRRSPASPEADPLLRRCDFHHTHAVRRWSKRRQYRISSLRSHPIAPLDYQLLHHPSSRVGLLLFGRGSLDPLDPHMTRKPSSLEAAPAARPHGTPLPTDACPQCGTMMEPKQGPLRHRVHGEDIEVPDVRHLGCAGSGEVVLSLDQATAWSKAAVQRYRNQHGLLSSEEIRAMRERFDLSQPELAALLRLDIDTIAPCESDRQSQPAAIDVLLRLVRDVPSNIQYLRTRAT